MKKNFIGLSTTIVSWIQTASLSLALVSSILTPASAKLEKIEFTTKPTVSQDRVTLRLKVTEENQRPALTLKEENFTVFVDGQEVTNVIDWKSAKDSQPTARILFLVDFSGSMKREDQSRKSKLEGAIRAIEEFIKSAKKRGGDIKIAILPFGEGKGANCPSHIVDSDTIDRKGFRSPSDAVLQQSLDYLKKYDIDKLCASTDLYKPLSNGIEYLADTTNTDFYPPLNPDIPEYDPQQPRQPQLSVILLSDGFHNKGNEANEFENLENTLNSNPKIIVHTLGYGLTPEELGQRIGKAKATRADLYYGSGKPPRGKISPEDFVDRDRLKQIADITNGIAEFSNNPKKVAAALTEFLDALDEYEITYDTPFAEEGKLYQVEVEVTDEGQTQKTDPPESYRVTWNSLPLPIRMSILGGSVIVLLVLGVLPWWLWGKQIKKQEQ